ncbi:MAG: CDP-alcohol phosphatidyltransferase family protein [Holosporales bacterium]|nr:CDP-alcohol phosphatidyltransferase family protein [Holosporales bacterium]
MSDSKHLGILRHIPNLISVFRIVCAPIFLFVLRNCDVTLQLATVLLGTISDFLDGYVARRYGLISSIGEILDPLADKIFFNAVLWGMYIFKENSFLIFLVALLLTIRDLSLILGTLIAVKKKLTISIRPLFSSKLCTTLLSCLAMLSIVFTSQFPLYKYVIFICFFYILSTFIMYIKRFYKICFVK